jgi:hypothetical protein
MVVHHLALFLLGYFILQGANTALAQSCSLPSPKVWTDSYLKVQIESNPCGFPITVRFRIKDPNGKVSTSSLFASKCGGKSNLFIGHPKAEIVSDFEHQYTDRGIVCGTNRKARDDAAKSKPSGQSDLQRRLKAAKKQSQNTAAKEKAQKDELQGDLDEAVRATDVEQARNAEELQRELTLEEQRRALERDLAIQRQRQERLRRQLETERRAPEENQQRGRRSRACELCLAGKSHCGFAGVPSSLQERLACCGECH